jgi:xanthine/uracil/vitamin C permease (AzgA family)
MLIFLIWLIAPIVQIILSSLRIKGRIMLPIIGNTVLSWVLGIALTVVALPYLVPPPPPSSSHPAGRCGMPEMAVLFGGIFIDGLVALFIGIFSYIFYLIKTKNDRKPQPPVIS